MSYDPRQGQNPYLGMDVDDYDELDDYDGLSDRYLDEVTCSSQSLSREDLTRVMGTSATVGAEPHAYQPYVSPYERDSLEGHTSVAPARSVPKTIRRPVQAPQRGVAPRGSTQDLGAPLRRNAYATSQAAPVQAVPSPAQQRPYEPEPSPVPGAVRSRFAGTLAFVASLPVWLVGFGLRLAAIALSIMVVAATFLTGSLRAQLVGTINMAPMLMPPALLGQFVYETPLGGVLRGDLAIASVLLFVADYACMRLAASLRNYR